MNIEQMNEAKNKMVAEARALLDVAKTENRSLNAEENTKYEAIKADIENMQKTIAAEERVASLESNIRKVPMENKEQKTVEDEIVQFRNYLKGEVRAGLITSVAPTAWSNKVLLAQGVASKIMPLITKYNVSSPGLSYPVLAPDFTAPIWGAETIADTGRASDSTAVLSTKSVTPLSLSKAIDVAKLAVESGDIAVEALIADAFSRIFATEIDKKILVGAGTTEPLGLFVASADGVTTAQDVVTAGSNAVHPDDIYNLIAEMEGYYDVSQLTLVLNPTIWQNILTAKASTAGNYMVAEWANAGTIRGVKVVLSGHAPKTLADNDYVAVIGDFSQYGLVQCTQMEVEPLADKARNLIKSYLGVEYVNGMPMLGTAFRRLKVKA